MNPPAASGATEQAGRLPDLSTRASSVEEKGTPMPDNLQEIRDRVQSGVNWSAEAWGDPHVTYMDDGLTLLTMIDQQREALRKADRLRFLLTRVMGGGSFNGTAKAVDEYDVARKGSADAD